MSLGAKVNAKVNIFFLFYPCRFIDLKEMKQGPKQEMMAYQVKDRANRWMCGARG